ncbi:MAG: hypothetical protein R3324_06050 [Halobacteriales archaeon]|nr:hypothetical protein [Halobacteriales archaeon]
MTMHDDWPRECVVCEGELEEDDAYWYNRAEGHGYGHVECDDRKSTVVRYGPGGEEKVLFSEYEVVDPVDFTEPGEDHWFERLRAERSWVSTDAWRGAYQVTVADGFTEIAGGWVTGHPDESVAYKVPTIELNYRLRNGEAPPVDLYWIFSPTSNVFSTASSIYVADEDLDALKAWLAAEGFLGIEKAFR